MKIPRLRQLEIFPVKISGKNLICLRDPFDYCDKTLFVPENIFYIIQFFNGENSIIDIQAAYMRKFSNLIFQEKILEIIKELDSHFLLENESYYRRKNEIEKNFLTSPIREPKFAGKSYSKQPAQLRKEIDSYFISPNGPGRIPDMTIDAIYSRNTSDKSDFVSYSLQEPSKGTLVGKIIPGKNGPKAIHNKKENLRTQENHDSGDSPDTFLTGLIIPHIDFTRGGSCYAWAYETLAREKLKFDLFIILGTNHHPSSNLFIFCRKNFITPFGILETDKDLVQILEDELGDDIYQDELIHRIEHTIEFQSVFLKYLYGANTEIQALPILCSTLTPEEKIKNEKKIDQTIHTLFNTINLLKKKTLVIASADLSHMGPQFGARFPLTSLDYEMIKLKDQELLTQFTTANAEQFYHEIMKEGNSRNICGLSPIYYLLKFLEGKSKGTLLKYGQFQDPMGLVSFASVAFYSNL